MAVTPKTFPVRIKRGSSVVSIYRVKNTGTASGSLYQVVYTVGEARRRKSFSDFGEANDEAILQADLLAAGKVGMSADASVEDLATLAEARRLCGSVPILDALAEWMKAREACGGELAAAAKLWRDTHAAEIENVTVAEAVRRFMASKEKAGVNTGASYLHCLNRLVTAFGESPISTVSTRSLQTWLETIAHPVSRNTHRKRIVALWRWCRKQGLLPRVAETEAERTERAREEIKEIGILTLDAWRSVLRVVRESHPEHLATLILAGFCGLRRSELHAQKWSDIHLNRKFLRVTSAKKNTPAKRLVQLVPAAVAWLRLCDRSGELIAPPWGLDKIRTMCREAVPPIECPENGFRHSFISYRVAYTGDVSETALEAGNSPKEIFKSYRELVTKRDGEAWFSLRPAELKP